MAFDKTIRINIVADSKGVSTGVAQANAQLSGLGKTVDRIGRSFASFAAIWAGRELIKFVGDSVKQFSEFEKGLANINIMMPEGEKRINEFADAASRMAVEFGVSTQELLKSGFDIMSATNNVSKSISIWNSATKLAVAGGSNLVDTTKGLLTLMESYGGTLRDTADASDLLLVTQEKARATIGEVAVASGKFLPMAAQLKISQEELFAVFAQMTRGLGSANEAATALGMTLMALLKPTDRMMAWAQQQYGMSIQQALAEYGLVDVLKKVKNESIENIGALFGRQRAIKGVMVALDDLGTIEGFVTDLTNREGDTQRHLQEQLLTTENRIKKLIEAWKEHQRVIGNISARVFLDTLAGLEMLKGPTELQDDLANMKRAWEDFVGSVSKSAAQTWEKIFPSGKENKFAKEFGGGLGTIPQKSQTDIIAEGFSSPKSSFNLGGPETKEGEGFDPLAKAQLVIDAEALKITELTSMWAAYRTADTAAELAKNQLAMEQYNFMIENMKVANASLWSIAGSMRDTFAKGLSSMFMDWMKGTLDVKTAFTNLGIKMVEIIVEYVAQMLIAKAIGMATMAAELVGIIAFGKAAFAALSPAAVAQSTISYGGAAIAGGASFSSSIVAAQMLGQAFAKGGWVNGMGKKDSVPALLTPGEYVLNREQASAMAGGTMNSNVTVNINGGIITSDPIQIQRLYREHLRDAIRNDIRSGKDRFYGG